MRNSKLWFVAFLLTLLSLACAGGALAASTEGASPKDEILFSCSQGGVWQIWGISPEGGAPRQLTHLTGDLFYPTAPSGGEKVVWADAEGSLWILEKSSDPRILSGLPPNCNYPSFSPDGSKIVYSSLLFTNQGEESDLWVTDLKRGKTFKLLEQAGIETHPSWAPDGLSIVYTSGARVSKTKVVEDLWLVDSDGSNKRPLVSNSSSNIQPSFSPDGKRIAFASDMSGDMEIWVIDKNRANLKRLTDHRAFDADPCWSPDGREICFASTRTGKMEIWVMQSDGSNPRQLTHFSDPGVESQEPYWTALRKPR